MLQPSKYRVSVDPKFCKGCEICIDKCPFKVFILSNFTGDYGVLISEAKYEEKCTGCNVCVTFCPDYAITVERTGGNESEK